MAAKEPTAEPGQAAYEAWMASFFGHSWQRVHDYWRELPDADRRAWAKTEAVARELERAAIAKWLLAGWVSQERVNLSHDIERGKHLEER